MKKTVILIMAILAVGTMAFSQCETWNDLPNKQEALEAHSIYRGMVNTDQFDEAFEFWKKAYEIAPAADGLRDYHYSDGIKIFMHKFQNETDEAKKAEYKQRVLDLYDQMIQCYENKVIKIEDCDDVCYNAVIGNIYANLAYDMYYYLQIPYEDNLEVAEKALKMADKAVDYTVFEPAMAIAVFQYQAGQIEAEKVREFHTLIDEATEFNVANDPEYGEYYDISRQRAFASLTTEIESEIFDCEYWKKQLSPVYEENPTDFDVLKYVFNQLKKVGCTDEDAFVTQIKGEYEELAKEYNESKRAELEQKNPALAANRLYKEENFAEAAAKYQEAIDKESDGEQKAKYLMSLASIQFRKLKQFNTARENALAAAELMPNWGQPYMLVGDMYATTASSCGDSWNQRLAVLAAVQKYVQAKSVDESVASDASVRISRYAGSRPQDEEIFMRNLQKGDVVKVGCWIGENVRL